MAYSVVTLYPQSNYRILSTPNPVEWEYLHGGEGFVASYEPVPGTAASIIWYPQVGNDDSFSLVTRTTPTANGYEYVGGAYGDGFYGDDVWREVYGQFTITTPLFLPEGFVRFHAITNPGVGANPGKAVIDLDWYIPAGGIWLAPATWEWTWPISFGEWIDPVLEEPMASLYTKFSNDTDDTFKIEGVAFASSIDELPLITEFIDENLPNEWNTIQYAVELYDDYYSIKSYGNILGNYKQKDFNLDLIVSERKTKSLNITSITASRIAKTFTLNNSIASRKLETVDISSVIANRNTETFNISSIVSIRSTDIINIDAKVSTRTLKTFTLNSYVKKTYSKNFELDGLLSESTLHPLEIDLLLKQTKIQYGLDYVVDSISELEYIAADALYNDTNGYILYGETFVPKINGTVSSCSFYSSRTGSSPSGYYTAYIATVTGTNGINAVPDIVIATSNQKQLSDFTGSLTWNTWYFDNTVKLNAGTTYAVYVTPSESGPTATNYLNICMRDADGITEVLADNFPSINGSSYDVGGFSTYPKLGQTFTGQGQNLLRIRASMQKILSPTGTLTPYLFSHVGVYGTNGVPGEVLQVGTPVNAADISSSIDWVTFDFPGTYMLESGVRYCFGVISSGGQDGSNHIQWRRGSGHAGTNLYFTNNSGLPEASWIAHPSTDHVFEVYEGVVQEELVSGTHIGNNIAQLYSGVVSSVNTKNAIFSVSVKPESLQIDTKIATRSSKTFDNDATLASRLNESVDLDFNIASRLTKTFDTSSVVSGRLSKTFNIGLSLGENTYGVESVTATSSGNNILVSWYASSNNETGFEIYRMIDSGIYVLVHTATADSTYWEDTPPAFNRIRYMVRSIR